jgi:2-dehydro-3-deoxyphosphooctonate aldolase (KDO 8-P synthase)
MTQKIVSQKTIKVGGIEIANDKPFVLFGGINVIESRDLAMRACEEYVRVTEKLGIPYVFKASFDKANRSSISGYRGPGMDKALGWFLELKKELDLPILTDVHDKDQCAEVASVVDVLQIPAFLCRQTDLIQAAAETKKTIHVKKGQFLSPWEVKNIIEKVDSCGNPNLCITERGTSFGYNNLVVDQRSFPVIRGFGVPVIFDGTHSAQLPGGMGNQTGGMREFIPNQVRAAIANGIDGLFMEVHPTPEKGLSDPATMYPLHQLEELLIMAQKIDSLVKRG